MPRKETDKLLVLFSKEIRLRLGEHLKQLILFGSKARGDDAPGSDYDCLVVVDEMTPRIANIIDEIAGELLFDHNAVFSVFPISERKFLRKTFDPLLLNINREGVAI